MCAGILKKNFCERNVIHSPEIPVTGLTKIYYPYNVATKILNLFKNNYFCPASLK